MRALMPFVPAILWAAIIWIVGGLVDTPSLPSGLGLDKVAHFGMYGVLGWLLGRAWYGQKRRIPGPAIFLLPLLIGAADELRQRSSSTRSGDWADWVADAAGAATGMAIALGTAPKPRNESRHADG